MKIQVNMDELPELPFELILNHLNLEDRLKSRTVSRRWYAKINSLKVKSLRCAEHPSSLLCGKGRWIRDAFIPNVISSPRLDLFFNTFRGSILSNLKYLRLYDLDSSTVTRAAFIPALNSFTQLEGLVIVRLIHQINPDAEVEFFGTVPDPIIELKLSLPMLNSIHLESLDGIRKLTLDTPRLAQIKWFDCAFMSLEIVHPESVERVITHDLRNIELKRLKNLKYLFSTAHQEFDSTLLSSLEKLEEIHMSNRNKIAPIFNQKQRFGRTSLKVYYSGCLLNGPNDPAIDSLSDYFRGETFVYLAENPSRLADEMPIYSYLHYPTFERVAPTLANKVFSRLTDCDFLYAERTIRDFQRFLDFLNNFDQIEGLQFQCDQPQDLFDRLPDHCNLQSLTIYGTPTDFQFLSRLKYLFFLHVGCSIDTDSIVRILEELEFLTEFEFRHMDKSVKIKIKHPKRFRVSVGGKVKTVNDTNAVIQFIIEHTVDDDDNRGDEE